MVTEQGTESVHFLPQEMRPLKNLDWYKNYLNMLFY